MSSISVWYQIHSNSLLFHLEIGEFPLSPAIFARAPEPRWSYGTVHSCCCPGWCLWLGLMRPWGTVHLRSKTVPWTVWILISGRKRIVVVACFLTFRITWNIINPRFNFCKIHAHSWNHIVIIPRKATPNGFSCQKKLSANFTVELTCGPLPSRPHQLASPWEVGSPNPNWIKWDVQNLGNI